MEIRYRLPIPSAALTNLLLNDTTMLVKREDKILLDQGGLDVEHIGTADCNQQFTTVNLELE
jgi:hypothetical protein